MVSYRNLFLQQSYMDSCLDYEKSLSGVVSPGWDHVVLTASNEAQALSYRRQLEHRISRRRLPAGTRYDVLPDPGGRRVGSGGATFNVIRHLSRLAGFTGFKGKKILVIHSGGDSKRIPQYSVCGKLFSPVPRVLPDGSGSTLFDEIMTSMAGVPPRMNDGMLVCSGDALILFNPLQIDMYSEGAAALSVKEDVSTGSRHGVYAGDDKGNVGMFLHKLDEDVLAGAGAVDSRGKVNIDTGAVILGSGIVEDLRSLVDTDAKFDLLVNEKVRLSFYADFLYPLASGSTEEGYHKQTPEGGFSEELASARRLIWDGLHGYGMRLIRLSPAAFIHFGTTQELLSLMTDKIGDFKFLDWNVKVVTNGRGEGYAARNSSIDRGSTIGAGSYIEDSYVRDGSVVGKGCVISCVDLEGVVVPGGTVLHGVRLNDGRFAARMYGVGDNPKEAMLFGSPIDGPLWTAWIYPVRDTLAGAVRAVLDNDLTGELTSLMDSFNDADVTAVLPWQKELEDVVKAGLFLEAVDARVPAGEAAAIFRNGMSEGVRDDLLNEAKRLSLDDLDEFSRKIRIYHYLSKLPDGDAMSGLCFGAIREAVLNAAGVESRGGRMVRDEVVVKLPLRVNWGAGWSDTPPHCLENGGNVLNAAITVGGRLPVEVVVRRADSDRIILASDDIGAYREFSDIDELRDCSGTGDPFALHKAALIICGVVPRTGGGNFGDIVERLGGGMYLSTRVIGIPKGSGLGTSSILAGACVRGIHEFLGLSIGDNELYNMVLCMEQIMSTGGGWQDQVGGMTRGIKMVSAGRGLKQDIICTPLDLSAKTLAELDERLVLIYTGQRRLARNLLREVVGKYIGSEPGAVDAMNGMLRLAMLMRLELEKGSVDGFARLLSEHWELYKKLDAGSTNTCIDVIFQVIDDLIDGRMICGAGGGGFLQVILKKDVCVDALNHRLDEVFADSGVEAWKCDFRM